MEALHARLLAAGVRRVSRSVVAPTVWVTAGGKVVYVRDPDGSASR